MGLISRFLDWLAGPLPKPLPLYSGENDRFDQPAAEAPRVYRSPRPPHPARWPALTPSTVNAPPRQDDSHVLPLAILLATQAASNPAPSYSPPSCDTGSTSYDSGSSSCDSGGSGW